MTAYHVAIRFQFPAHDERDGIIYTVEAPSKAGAVALVRVLSRRDGHTGNVRGKGRITFTATAQ